MRVRLHRPGHLLPGAEFVCRAGTMRGFVLLLLAAVMGVCAADSDLEGGVPVFKFPPDPEECGANEEWKQCVSSTCAETTCKKRVVGPGCTYDCRYGCYCSEGFYRNAQGNCVTLDQCPPEEGGQPDADHPECGTNEEYKVCVSSSCAETTCERRTIGPACTADCQRGCYCSSGFHRNAQGNCVTEDQCPSAPSE